MTFTKQSALKDSFVSTLHRYSPLRAIAKRLLQGFTIKQPFHGGLICLDAVEHSWAWTGSRRYQTFDKELQDKLLDLSQKSEVFIDIGANIGAMTLSILLRNSTIDAVCIDPNSRALSLLQLSTKLNHLEHRCEAIDAAVSNSEGSLKFDETGSVTGHVSGSGKEVRSIDFVQLVNRYSGKKCLVKIDIEGFETHLFKNLESIVNRENIWLAIELHPLNFNGVGNPSECLSLLRESRATIVGIHSQPLKKVRDGEFTQIFVTWAHG